MIRCTPNGVCSWSFDLAGDGHRGSTTIEVRVEDADFPTVCFGFWLSVLTWRRAASDS